MTPSFFVRKAREAISRGRGQREGPLVVLQVLAVGVVANRDDGAHPPRQVLRDVVEPDLPAVAGLGREHAGAPVRKGAERARRARGDRHADGRLGVVDEVPEEDSRRLRRRRPAELLPDPDRPGGEEVDLGRQVRGLPGHPVVGEPQIRAAPLGVSDPRHEQPGDPPRLRRPDHVRRVEERQIAAPGRPRSSSARSRRA